MHFDLMQSISLCGHRDTPNDDRAGTKASCSWVIDGATDLGPPGLLGDQGGAAWLAAAADAGFSLSRGNGLTETCAQMFQHVAERFRAEQRRKAEHLWELPTAAFAAVQLVEGALEIAWVADCAILLRSGTAVNWCTPMVDRASERAAAVALGEGIGGRTKQIGAALETLRRLRSCPNRRVLGVDARASSEATNYRRLTVAPGDSLLLMTDGFSALIDPYGAYGPDDLFAAVVDRGLASLGQELRGIEREDAACLRYSRFKRSDDATALWVRVAGPA